ncbi:cytochrome c oxidase subunit II [Thermoleptolyngbya sp. M55_K2018_002]|uniref:cytochrome c oxidase subunit II n=1 Tax=Thermoleptolyngbya sp. M55_K2018_002 TaxID=2747808 RepID=UPI0019F9C910|nr:cytochrome c oxidase subunit II [Thermoleptolyngbya sp. M55_K2018_002]HIK41099.1 cytochrome c oxidase subunit II [Thermoleptolyngbya sp. M55_K2018_002]
MNLKTIAGIGVYVAILVAASIWVGQQAYGWLPPQASAESMLIDDLFSLFSAIGAFILLGITGLVLYTVFTQSVSRFDTSDGPHMEGNVKLEIFWTAVPLLLVFFLAAYSYQTYQQMAVRGPMDLVHLHHMPGTTPTAYAADLEPEPLEEVEVYAKQWAWSFRYPNAGVVSADLHLPVNKRVRLRMTADEVIHGFYVPAFRLKQDIMPKRTTEFEFTPVREGTYRLNDSQFSGTYFAIMTANVVVESPDSYRQWLASAAAQPVVPAENPAYSEYTNKRLKRFGGWKTITPAPPPLVNALAEG